MTINQMSRALQSVGACFAVTTAKTILPNDGFGAKPSYHIHPDASYPDERAITCVYSQAQLRDWVNAAKCAQRCNTPADAFDVWQAYEGRWE